MIYFSELKVKSSRRCVWGRCDRKVRRVQTKCDARWWAEVKNKVADLPELCSHIKLIDVSCDIQAVWWTGKRKTTFKFQKNKLPGAF